jgi:hypothetical protein
MCSGIFLVSFRIKNYIYLTEGETKVFTVLMKHLFSGQVYPDISFNYQ